MSNKLQQLKKKLLSFKPTNASIDEKVDHNVSANSSIQLEPQAQHRDILNGRLAQNQQQPSQLTEIAQSNKLSSKSGQESSPGAAKSVKAFEPHQNVISSARTEQKKDPKVHFNEQQEGIQDGQIFKPQQLLVKLRWQQQAASLDLVDKYPNLSYSIDEEVKIPPTEHKTQNNEQAAVPVEKESKQQQKKQKIVLKELELVKECIRNLRSSVKGLERLQVMVQEKPAIKHKIKHILMELNKSTNVITQQ